MVKGLGPVVKGLDPVVKGLGPVVKGLGPVVQGSASRAAHLGFDSLLCRDFFSRVET